MTSIRIKFRPSTVDGKEGSIYFQIIHNRVVRLLNTDYKVYAEEWEATAETVILDGNRPQAMHTIKEYLEWDIARLRRVVKQLEMEQQKFTTDDVIANFQRLSEEMPLSRFMNQVIEQLKQLGRIRTSETYVSALSSFMKYRDQRDVPLDGITSDLMLQYEAYLKHRGVRMNTISFYMRILRAVYNRAVEKGLTDQRKPFRHVYTGIDKTEKRAVPVKTLKSLKSLDLSDCPALDFARDMFLFSFYTRGMSFIDMAYLRKQDLQNGTLTYKRRKTGQRLTIRWEKCMAEIAYIKYKQKDTDYLLPIITHSGDERKQYKNALRLVNRHLKDISKQLQLPKPLTMYVARHSWASVAKSRNIPLSIISEGMGHDSETTTLIYLASLETSAVDNANKKIISLL